ncbi:Proton-dependent oligopeptide transporter family [Corchorus capsularis]|uniref:Proton-dependent oligopeptide transporter family n=1 Tax=Corchorus capsularis TaxID=210143 RepID=A0A1R3G0T4_COCAP|nr:Proton-dependent oligopeptide transporter family [Corchorus capsularis]
MVDEGRQESKNCRLFIISEEENGVSARNQKRPAGWKAMPFILGNATFERLASYGLMANFMVYLQREYHMDQVQAATILNSWSGASNLAPLLGAYVSDAYIGKFWTIVIGSFSSLLGMVIMTLTALLSKLRPPSCSLKEQAEGHCQGYNKAQLGVLISSLFWLCIGTGGIKPCSIPFSVDQFDLTSEQGRKGNNSFYNLYYTTQTIVLLITQTIVVYIQNDVSWALGFGIPTLCMFFAIVLFFVGTKIYIFERPEGSLFGGVAQVFVAAFRKRKVKLPADGGSSQFYDPPLKRSLLSKDHLTKQHSCLNKAAFIEGDEVSHDGFCMNPWRLCSIQQVEDVKCLVNIIPIWLTSILGFLAMNQQGTFTVSQALKMDLNFGPKINIPAGSIGVITLIAIALWLPFYDRILVPELEKITKQENGITLLQRIGIGNLFAILTMLVSGLIETKRRQSAISHGSPDGVAPMSVFWLAPQLVLIGFSEIFSMIGLIEFYNKQFPEHMRSIGNSIIYLTYSLASYASSFVITIVHDVTGKQGSNWLTEDINTSKLDYFYFLIAGLSLMNFVMFMYCARRYQYKGSAKILM